MVTDASPPPAPGSRTRTFGFDVLLTAGGKVLFLGSGALITVIVARFLGPDGQGTFAVAYSLTLMLVQLGSVGLPIANPYYAARHPEQTPALARLSLRLAVALTVVLVVGTVVVDALFPGLLRGLTTVELAITLGALPAALATLYLQGILLGQRRMFNYNLVEVSQVGSSMLVLVGVILFASPGLPEVLLIVAGGRYVALGIVLWSLRDDLGRSARRAAPPAEGLARRVLHHGGRVYVVGLLTFALIRLDLLIVNSLLGADAAGQYSIAVFIAEALVVIPMVVGTNLLPRVATVDDNDLTASVVRVLSLVWGAICVLSVPAAAIGIPLIFGGSYDEAVPLYLYLVPGLYAMGMLNALITHYFVRGYPRSLIGVWVVALIGNVVLNVVLLPELGVEAAPLLSTVAYLAVLVAHIRSFAHDTGGYAALRPRPRETLQLIRGAFGR